MLATVLVSAVVTIAILAIYHRIFIRSEKTGLGWHIAWINHQQDKIEEAEKEAERKKKEKALDELKAIGFSSKFIDWNADWLLENFSWIKANAADIKYEIEWFEENAKEIAIKRKEYSKKSFKAIQIFLADN